MINGIDGKKWREPSQAQKTERANGEQTNPQTAGIQEAGELIKPNEPQRADHLEIRLVSKNGIPVDPSEEQLSSPIEEEKLPQNYMFLALFDGIDVSREFRNVFMEYFVYDKASETDIKQTMDNAVALLRNHYAEKGLDADEITPKIIEEVYESCRLHAFAALGDASYFEGRAVAKQFTGYNSDTTKLYYNSDFYYRGEEMKDLLLEYAEELGKEYGVSELKLFRDYPEGDIRKRIYDSYNTLVNDRMRHLCVNMIDETFVPPRDFRFFYVNGDVGTNQYPPSMGKGETIFDSGLHIWYKGWSFSGRVPVRMDTTRYPASINMLDLIKSYGQGYPEEIEEFLGNFDMYSIVASGVYLRSHPRKF